MFLWKTKKLSLNTMCKFEQYQKVYYELGNVNLHCEYVLDTLETYICNMFGVGNTKTNLQRKINYIRIYVI